MKKKKLKRKVLKYNKEKHYVNNEKLLQHMVSYRNSVKKWKDNDEVGDKPKVDDYIGLCLLNIAERFARMPKFCNWPFTEEMIADSIENCLRYIDNFNPEKSKNPFSYFTQITYYAFLRRIQKENRQVYIKYKAIDDLRINSDDVEIKTMMENFGTSDFNKHMEDFISSYEEYNVTNKKKKKKSCKKSNDLDDLIEE